MINRSAAWLTLLLLPACAPGDSPGDPDSAAPGAYDLLIAGGNVVDGTGAPARRADVLVRSGRIAHVGEMDADTIDAGIRETFDATGLVIAPGFIDAHAHGDPTDPETNRFENFLAQGVTTIVLGQDGGSSPAAELAAHLDSVAAARPGVNVAYLVGHNTIRRESGVEFGDPGTEGLVRMSELVAQGLEAGAFGLSTGLEYDPGSRAGFDELVAVARPVAEVGAVVSSHLRSEDADRVEESLDELIAQGRHSGARVHASHLKIVLGRDTVRAAALLDQMARARAEGVEVTADVYPYTASYTGIGILFPDWAKPPNDYDSVLAERRDELADYLRERVESRNGPEATRFGTGNLAGRTLAEVAERRGVPYEDVLVELGPDGASAAYFVMDENVMRWLLRDPNVAVSSDGSPTMLHPRGYGSFAKVIRRYVVEEAEFTIEEAVRKMSGLTAQIFRLDDPTLVDAPRGQVAADFAADLVAFDPAEVEDRADFERPHLWAGGMRAVWVNGRLAWRDGEPPAAEQGETAEHASHGKVLRARR
ncbi:MAG: N-acyl-D-amino-acid deacylase family protein [Gemmatimonadota bacterium]